jgi:hypothetical protein
VRWLLIEAVYTAVREDPALRQDYQRLKFRRGHAVAKVAIARKLAVRMYWMLRSGADSAFDLTILNACFKLVFELEQ